MCVVVVGVCGVTGGVVWRVVVEAAWRVCGCVLLCDVVCLLCGYCLWLLSVVAVCV